MKKTIIFILSLLISVSTFSQGIAFEQGEWKDVLNKAKELNKTIFVDIYTTWCGPCKRMSAEIFPLEEVGKVYNQHFVCYKIDAEKGEGIVLAKKYDVKFYPTYLFINPDGSLLMKAIGSMPAEEFIGLTDKVLAEKNDPKTLSEWEKEYESKKTDPNFVLSYMDKRTRKGLPNAMIFDQYLSLLSKEDRVSDKIIEYYQLESRDIQINSLAYNNLSENEAIFSPKIGKMLQALQASIIENTFREACKMKDEKMLELVISENEKMPKTEKSKTKEDFYRNYYIKTGNKDKAVQP